MKIFCIGRNYADHAKELNNPVPKGLGIDFTARDIQKRCKEKGHPWEIAKAFDYSAPISEFIPYSEWEDKDIPFTLEKNGIIVQQGNTADLIFDFGALIAHVSKFFTLKMGDLIFTGTPAGVGPVKIGDRLQGFIDGKEMLKCDIR
jgi:2-keto-4-pentenoate hydratase/2-oxohepta-3-ene-1,7-dioic acid hydratase in catechol pathway